MGSHYEKVQIHLHYRVEANVCFSGGIRTNVGICSYYETFG
jgi:hypothetical protein